MRFSILNDFYYLLRCDDKAFFRQLHHILGFYPHRIDIYHEAFMHRSLNYHKPHEKHKDNERLEYLGDAIIDAVVSDILYHHFENQKEGFLTSLRSKIVQRNSLNHFAQEIGLSNLIQSSCINHTHNSFLSGNAFEAFVGAIYLDRGYKYCYEFLLKQIITPYVNLEKIAKEDTNFKSKLIEWGQKNQYLIEFELINEKTIGTNSPTFQSRVCIEGIEVGNGFGYSKKESQQKAAQESIRHIRKKSDLYTKVVKAHENRIKSLTKPLIEDKDENNE